MRNTFPSLTHTALLTILALVAGGCLIRGPGRGGDDDDDTGDDDTGDDDTGDDDTGDDDTGDDDTGDDDTGDDDDDLPFENGSSVATGQWVLSYFSDMQGQNLVCDQTYDFTALIEQRPNVLGNACPSCSGKVDVTSIAPNATASQNACAPNQLDAQGAGADLGAVLTGSQPQGDFFQTQALLDASTGVAGGQGVTLDGQTTFQSLQTDLASSGATFTHGAYYSPSEAVYFGQVGLDTVAVSVGGSAGYLPFWFYYTQTGATNGNFDGQYGLQSFWILQNSSGTVYQSVTFAGFMDATFTPSGG